MTPYANRRYKTMYAFMTTLRNLNLRLRRQPLMSVYYNYLKDLP